MGGWWGGSITRGVPWTSGGTAADSAMIASSNAAMDVRINTGIGSVIKGLGGSAEQSLPMPGTGSSSKCGCH